MNKEHILAPMPNYKAVSESASSAFYNSVLALRQTLYLVLTREYDIELLTENNPLYGEVIYDILMNLEEPKNSLGYSFGFRLKNKVNWTYFICHVLLDGKICYILDKDEHTSHIGERAILFQISNIERELVLANGLYSVEEFNLKIPEIAAYMKDL